ncbi:AAA family ATPase [Comamonas testosteroni]|uniref:ExeA family protein n=1 Tax=Comamonas testosteroni TaxID=285 RepID=UPI0028EBDB5A|nr:AAA family ATPase [Comamonas testosteroni]
MLLRKHTITPDAREYFHLERDPFTNEMRGVADVFLNDNIKKVRAAVRNVAEHGGMLAVIAESGAGKSTIRKDLAHWIKNSDRPVVVIEPYVIGMEDDPTKGRPLKAEDVVTSVMRRLSPSTKIARSNQKRLEQMHDQLKISAAAGNHHILIIEEAHRLAVPTIRHMKTFYELDDGFTPLLGILLVGQTELGWKLGDGNFEVREVVQRLEKRYIEPMDLSDVTLYLRHKFDRIGANFDKVFAADAVEAMVQRLRVTTETRLRGHRTLGPRSLCYPLAINNLASGAINLAHQGGEELVTAALIAQVGREE